MTIKPPISLYSATEQAVKEAISKTLPLQIAIQGMDVKHQRQNPRPQNDAYGRAGGTGKNSTLNFLGMEKILMSGSQWRFIDNNEDGYLDQEDWVYCSFDLRNGDVLTVTRLSDQKEIDFVASEIQEIGNTTTILKRFLMSNINGS